MTFKAFFDSFSEHPNVRQSNGRALFRMLDPTGTGKIEAAKMKEILEVFNLKVWFKIRLQIDYESEVRNFEDLLYKY